MVVRILLVIGITMLILVKSRKNIHFLQQNLVYRRGKENKSINC